MSRVASNTLITADAINAVNKLTPSQTARRGAVFNTEPNVSSSSPSPARLMSEWSASSRITSTTSSMVIRPIIFPSLSTTGADTQSLRSKRLATSLSSILAGMASISVFMISRTVVPGSETSTRRNGSKPIYSSRRFTTIKLSIISGSSSWRRKYLKTTSISVFGRTVMASVFIKPPAVSSG